MAQHRKREIIRDPAGSHFSELVRLALGDDRKNLCPIDPKTDSLPLSYQPTIERQNREPGLLDVEYRII